MLTQSQVSNAMIEQRNMMTETIFTYWEYYKLQSFAESIPFSFTQSFYTGLCKVRDSLPTIVYIEVKYSNTTSNQSYLKLKWYNTAINQHHGANISGIILGIMGISQKHYRWIFDNCSKIYC